MYNNIYKYISTGAKSPVPVEEPVTEPVLQSDEEGSRPPSRSILKSPSRSSSPMSRKSSSMCIVHFPFFMRHLSQQC